MRENSILEEIHFYVAQLFSDRPDERLVYHNLGHTLAVVAHSREIAVHYAVGEEDQFVLLTAAYFHDTGHLFGFMEGHEQAGVDIMRDFFKDLPIAEEELRQIAGCILATKWPVHPRGLLEEILCDADTFHLGTDEFIRMDPRVWEEFVKRTGKSITPSGRLKNSVRFMEVHRFFTEYCQNLLNEGKAENLALLNAKSRDMH